MMIGGYVYQGDWEDDSRHGKGILKRIPSINSTYTLSWDGNWKNGNFTNGKMEDKIEGYEYTGKMENWSKEDYHGKMDLYDGGKYDGRFIKNTFSGEGKYLYPDGRKFNGVFYRGKIDGRGTMIYPDKTEYSGRYLSDFRSGSDGIMKNKDGSMYRGDWTNDMKSGEGKLTRRDFIKQGDFRKDLFHGDGRVTLGNKKEHRMYSFKGKFIEGFPEKIATINFSSKIKVKTGELKDQIKFGSALFDSNHDLIKGRVVFENGDKYTGEFKEGKFEGQGTYDSVKQGTKYTGTFSKGNYGDGNCTFTTTNYLAQKNAGEDQTTKVITLKVSSG
jgi:hypothetical protein